MLETQIDDVWVMFDGMDDETSMAIRGRAASFTRGEANLLELARRKTARGLSSPRITVQMIRQPRNQHQWEMFRHHWHGIPGIDGAYLDYYSTFSGSVGEINDIGADLAHRDTDQAAELARRQYLAEFPCVYPWHSVSVTWDGKVVPCCRDVDAAVVLGDLRRRPLEQIWNDTPLQSLRAQFASRAVAVPLCASCTEPSLEVGLPRYYTFRTAKRRLGDLLSGHPATPTGQ